MEDRHVVAMAVAVALGAWWARSVPGWADGRAALFLLVAVVVLGLRRRRPIVVVVAACALAAILGARAWGGLDPPDRSTRWAGAATLVSDPVRIGAGRKVDLRLEDGRRVEAFAYGAAGRAVADLLAGERISGTGNLAAPPSAATHRLAAKHIAARLSLTGCRPESGGRVWFRAANGLRRALMSGTSSLDPERRALWSGIVLGDDRDEDPGITDDFSAAGLLHLMAVSGQNVSFTIAAAGPLLRRFGLRGRLVASLGVLGFFGVVVRFEPSVLRASAMAALALTAGSKGVESSSIRLVALAATGLVFVDPLLVHRLGFQLSVAATVGIALGARPIAARLRGPAFLREALATTLAAQAAVAPLLVGLGGTSPVAVPANMLAVPAAGPLMVWGLTGGLVAGIAGGSVAALIHLPTRLLLTWLVLVASVAADVPLAPVGLVVLGLVTLLAIAAALTSGKARRRMVAVALVVFVVPSAVGASLQPTAAGSRGIRIWQAEGVTLVVVSAADPARALGALRRSNVDAIDLLIADGTGSGVLAVLAAVLERHDVSALRGPPRLDVAGMQVLDPGVPLTVGPFIVTTDQRHHPTVARIRGHQMPKR